MTSERLSYVASPRLQSHAVPMIMKVFSGNELIQAQRIVLEVIRVDCCRGSSIRTPSGERRRDASQHGHGICHTAVAELSDATPHHASGQENVVSLVLLNDRAARISNACFIITLF